MSTCMIVDGNPLAWRASKMYENLTANGMQTGVIFGALENLVKGLEAVRPDCYCIVWDFGKSRWRKAIYPPYKANRHATKTPEEAATVEAVYSQIEAVQQILQVAGVKQIKVPAVEADDIIGILASGLDITESYDKIVILGGDKDLYQLVRGEVYIYEPIRKGWIDEAGVVAAFEGIGPKQVTSFKALTGDTSDEIKGVGGIGPKRAAQLLKDFGSLDAILSEVAEELLAKNKWSARLATQEGRDLVRLNERLVTITTVRSLDLLNEPERQELASQMFATVERQAGMALDTLLERYSLRKVVSSLSLLCGPSPDFSKLSQWIS